MNVIYLLDSCCPPTIFAVAIVKGLTIYSGFKNSSTEQYIHSLVGIWFFKVILLLGCIFKFLLGLELHYILTPVCRYIFFQFLPGKFYLRHIFNFAFVLMYHILELAFFQGKLKLSLYNHSSLRVEKMQVMSVLSTKETKGLHAQKQHDFRAGVCTATVNLWKYTKHQQKVKILPFHNIKSCTGIYHFKLINYIFRNLKNE